MARRKKTNEDTPQENSENPDDTFGLPEIEYEPLKREESPKAEAPEEPVSESTPVENPKQSYTQMEEETPQEENTTSYYNNEDDDSSPWPKILGITAVLLVIGAAVWYFGFYRPQQQAKLKEQQEQIERDEAKRREAALAEQKRIADEQRRADSLANLAPAAGVIDTLTERTGRYYVIIASNIDGDLLMDYAKKLAAKGLSPKLIPPHGKVKYNRLAIAEGDTFASTQATADQIKSQYDSGAWVVKY